MQEGGSDSTRETSEEKNISSQSAKDCSPNWDLFEEKPGVDHFKNEERDPKDANAMSKFYVSTFCYCGEYIYSY